MNVTEKILEKIEDLESIVQTLNAMACAIENGTDMPNYIPMLNDGLTTDNLSTICEALKKARQ